MPCHRAATWCAVRPASPHIALVYCTSVSLDFTCTPTPRMTSSVPASIRETGGAATFVRFAYNDFAGFLTGWVFVLYSPVVAGPSLAVLGQILQDELQSNYGITFPWYAAVIIGIPLVA